VRSYSYAKFGTFFYAPPGIVAQRMSTHFVSVTVLESISVVLLCLGLANRTALTCDQLLAPSFCLPVCELWRG